MRCLLAGSGHSLTPFHDDFLLTFGAGHVSRPDRPL
ncbi:hypothetical protein QE369_001167 [Agrobacterium larrymoorei]|uniref:Uncharacterized protein n=1 Tax=Agrobacterium larrymoorei TaxID=160699 RepID=A0AAJ2EQT2_9HYPH|nr:hypothetical protein [Agrobacterium larrymoorei]